MTLGPRLAVPLPSRAASGSNSSSRPGPKHFHLIFREPGSTHRFFRGSKRPRRSPILRRPQPTRGNSQPPSGLSPTSAPTAHASGDAHDLARCAGSGGEERRSQPSAPRGRPRQLFPCGKLPRSTDQHTSPPNSRLAAIVQRGWCLNVSQRREDGEPTSKKPLYAPQTDGKPGPELGSGNAPHAFAMRAPDEIRSSTKRSDAPYPECPFPPPRTSLAVAGRCRSARGDHKQRL